jgi:hypothetical protein
MIDRSTTGETVGRKGAGTIGAKDPEVESDASEREAGETGQSEVGESKEQAATQGGVRSRMEQREG